VLLLAGAASFYLWFRHEVSGANARVTPEIRVALTAKPSSTLVTVPVPPSPSAMNLLVVGADKRPDENEKYGRSDTIILVHVDPDNNYLSMLSLPRDLRVSIPGYGVNKINAAYAYGGPALTITTVEQLTGVDINHYVEVSFQAFEDITNALGGVYVDVDKYYWNENPAYELAKLNPGYQLLDGADALDYVRFRHDLNLDFGRMERQQIFLSAIREQAMGWDLPIKLPKLVSALFNNVTTDLGANDVIRLAYWGVRLDGNRIRRVSLTGTPEDIGGISYVVASDAALADAVTTFLTLPGTTPSTQVSTATTTTTTAPADLSGVEMDILNGNGREGEATGAAKWLTDLGASVVTVGNAGKSYANTVVEYGSGMSTKAKKVAGAVGVDTTWNSNVPRVTLVLGEDFVLPPQYALPPNPDNIPAAGGWKTIAESVPFAVEGPAYIPQGYYFAGKVPPNAPTYGIQVGGGKKPAFKMLYRLKDHGSWTDQYMGIMETSWLDAPAASQGREVEHGGTVFTIVGPADKVDRVWWKAGGTLYWVSNTLFHRLSEADLLAVAESMVQIPAQ
jgi:LCP family protein required for cell wall assembly